MRIEQEDTNISCTRMSYHGARFDPMRNPIGIESSSLWPSIFAKSDLICSAIQMKKCVCVTHWSLENFNKTRNAATTGARKFLQNSDRQK